jgi:membrane associated rhomboid family serine protease
VVGGWVFYQVFSPGQDPSAIVAAASSVGAFVGSVIVCDVMGMIMNQRAAKTAVAQKG